MSSVTSHVESSDPIDSTPLSCEATQFGARPQSPDVPCVPDAAITHQKLLDFAWIRAISEELLVGRSFDVVTKKNGQLAIKISPPIAPEAIPWWSIPGGPMALVNLFGRPQKMVCPTFDLPTGHPYLGGSCLAAGMCQTTTPLEARLEMEERARQSGIILRPSGPTAHLGGDEVHVLESICSQCYAQGGRFTNTNMQVRMAVRYHFTQQMLSTEAGLNAWVDVIVRALEAEEWLGETVADPRTGEPVLPVRLHSSGDFFSPKYAQAWVYVANQFPQLLFWAPTRTWASPGWLYHWQKILEQSIHGNFIVRPSALHFGDHAPTPRGTMYPWNGPYPFNAAGTTALYGEGLGQDATPIAAGGNNFGGEWDKRYDWGCQAYHRVREMDAPNCAGAVGPDGGIGCRACWTHPGLRINFSAH